MRRDVVPDLRYRGHTEGDSGLTSKSREPVMLLGVTADSGIAWVYITYVHRLRKNIAYVATQNKQGDECGTWVFPVKTILL